MLFFLFHAEQLEIDAREASLKRVEMRGEPGHEIEVALPDEFKGDRSGPVFFPHAQDEEDFKKKFADARLLPLSPSSFKGVNGVYHLRMDRTGIPTGSYYALSLPTYSVPSQINVQDPRSARTLDKYVVRDDNRKCYVIYVDCQSVSGTFDFRLEIKFTIEKRRGMFENSEYPDDGHVKRYNRGIGAEKNEILSEHIELVKRLLPYKTSQDEGDTGGSLPLHKDSCTDGLPTRLRDGKRCAQVIEEMKLIKKVHDHDRLTITQIEERYKDFEVWAIVDSRFRHDSEALEHFRSPGLWERQVVPYALSILEKEYKRAPSTINDWVKDYRRYLKEKK